MASAILRVMQNCYLYPKNDKKEEPEHESNMIHLQMSATEGWVSISDALDYLWHKVYSSEPPAVDWSKRLLRSIYIKAYWPPAPQHREEVNAIHLDNLHILFDDPTHMQSVHVVNEAYAINNFKTMVSNSQNVKDDAFMVIVEDARKTASQVR